MTRFIKPTEIEGIERVRMLYAMLSGIPEPRVKVTSWRAAGRGDGYIASKAQMTKHACGTTACAAGWAAIYPPFNALGLFADRYGRPSVKHPNTGYNSCAAFFDMSFEEARNTFSGEYFEEAGLTQKQTALARIRAYLVEKGAITLGRSEDLRAHELAGTFEAATA